MHCIHCNQEHSISDHFCPITGKAINEELFCLNCGVVIESDWDNCLSCNYAIKDLPTKTGIKIRLGGLSYWFWVAVFIGFALQIFLVMNAVSSIAQLPLIEEIISAIEGMFP